MFCAPIYYSLAPVRQTIITKLLEGGIYDFYNVGVKGEFFLYSSRTMLPIASADFP